MALLYIGTISKPHGIHGSCLVGNVTALPSLPPCTPVHIGYSEHFGSKAILDHIEPYRNGALLTLRGVDSIEAVDALREQGVFVDAIHISSDDRSLFDEVITGATVRLHSDGSVLGSVREVWSLPAQRMIVVETAEGNELLIPFVPSIVKSVTQSPLEIIIDPPSGLLDINEEGIHE